MVDFSNNRNRFRGGLQPSRSLPMSTLNQRERTAPSAQRSIRQVRRVTSSQDNALSPPSTPNPYTGRSEVKVRRTPQRAVSHHSTQAAARSRSSSPSKYDTTSSLLLCPTSPTECLIPNSNKRRRNNTFGLVKAMIRALTLIVLGFCFGVVYNFYTTTALKAHIDVESIPAVVLTDELVKKLAHDNQLQEQEIDTLKHQVDEARHKAEREEQQNAGSRKQAAPPQMEAKEKEPITATNTNPGGGLRAVRRFTWDDAGNNVQEIPLDQGGESAAYFSPSGKSKDSHDNHHAAPKENLLDSHHISNEEDHEFNRDNYEEEAMVHQQQQQQQKQQQAEMITAQAPPEPHDLPPPPKQQVYNSNEEDHHVQQQQQTQEQNNNVDAQQRGEYYHQEGHEDHPQHKQPSEDENQRHHPTEEQANVDQQQREEYYHQEGHQNNDQQQQQEPDHHHEQLQAEQQ